MTVTIQINGENVEVKLTPEQYNKALAEIEESKKPKKFEFKYPAVTATSIQLKIY